MCASHNFFFKQVGDMAIKAPIQESVISSFINQYKQNEYEDLAKRAADSCKHVLLENDIPHQIWSRGKDPESLRKKLEQREHKNGTYRTLEHIYNDIVDLAGARIILDRWEDRDSVNAIIYQIFEVKKEEYKKEESGYEAVHYRVYLKQGGYLRGSNMTEMRPLVEIQVQFLYMAQWAKVEHSSRYKTSVEPNQALENSLDNLVQIAHLHERFARQTREERRRQEAKQKEKFSDVNHVGHYLKKWIRDSKNAAHWAKDEVEAKNTGSATALTIFLDAREWRTPESLNQLLQEHFSEGAPDEYSSIAKSYAGIKMNLIIYLMDRIVLKREIHNAHSFQVPKSREEHAYKIEVILSTFIWINRLFSPTFEWQRLFTRLKDQEILRQGILWLGSGVRQDRIREGASLTKNEVRELNRLWDWFSSNPDRPIMFVFTMSNQGVVRNIPKERDEVEDALGPLCRALGHAPVWF
ncbi:RelA/SpoT [Penicillium macrosclerotiorum]|uniref:RelA/SpoT n=1 Tax=Penicillium macrosclerotiorum TaxID=303699 RepID=UPI0025497D3E|nr:RelA/SpoT [Penicillium macrosclerotiorum]KAJ5666761.1 RelA/SpoT [Penicillium macrosclerotiorum]